MQIRLAGITVDDQENALRFYTTVVGFVKKTDLPMGQFRWLTVSSPEGVDVIELAAEQGPVESIEDLVARNDMSKVVADLMTRLPEEQRTAIILKEYHGMTFQEIADLQRVPLSTVKTRLYQGLNVLRRHLQQQGKYDPATTKVS